MRIWPVILDSQPAYLQGTERPLSILLAPIGTETLIEHLRATLTPVTGNAPVVMAPAGATDEYVRSLHAVCPTARVMRGPEEFGDVFAYSELSDAYLVVDPRCLTLGESDFATLVHEYSAEPRVAHSLVAFEAVAGTKEHVSFDNAGQVRGIQRFYDQTTWAMIAGIGATIVPAACKVLGSGEVPSSLVELRQILAGRGVPSRDIPVQAGAIDLASEHGLLAANERFAVAATSAPNREGRIGKPLFLGDGHAVHPTARMVGPVVVHHDVVVEAGATILGPAIIGAGARIASGAIVAHATILAGGFVPSGQIVRDQVWLGLGSDTVVTAERRSPSYDQRLARHSIEPSHSQDAVNAQPFGRRFQLLLKRAVDISFAALSLAIVSPMFILSGAAVWLESRGPIFYGDKREGLGGRGFRCWKFRTMFTGAHLAQRDLNALDHTDGPHFKCDSDPRVTRVGKILRMLNLDELPQLVNVLMGQMSLVGPRPSPFRENQVCVPWREARLSVRPGITGFWQVCRHDRASGDFHQWIEYDLLYVQHLSLWLDIKILTATLVTLGGKATHVPASWLVRSASIEGAGLPEQSTIESDEIAAA
jgi:lipopolysaccharide/colanic/teichoic acid biosynthesis glycosyltransferase